MIRVKWSKVKKVFIKIIIVFVIFAVLVIGAGIIRNIKNNKQKISDFEKPLVPRVINPPLATSGPVFKPFIKEKHQINIDPAQESLEIKDLVSKQDDKQKIFKFAVTGHVYANLGDLEYILRDLNEKKIENLFIGGDIENNILNKIDNFKKKYNVNIVPAPGNHEIQDLASEQNYYDRFGKFKSFEIAGVNFIILSTLLDATPPFFPHGGSSIQKEQLEFLRHELKRLKDKPVAIIMHHALWSLDLSAADKLKMASSLKINQKYELKDIQFPSNDTAPNDWTAEIHPLLSAHGQVSVFAGDASLSTFLKKDGVDYYTTGLRQKEKGDWIVDNLQSYLLCSLSDQKIQCQIEYFPAADILSSKNNVNENS